MRTAGKGIDDMATQHYVIITPVRDEEEHLEKTIHSVASQSLVPRLWVIVDDGSRDGTGRIADAAAQRYPWVRVVHRADRGYRQAGGGVVEAFYAGYELVKDDDRWAFIVKLDGDLEFDPTYFEHLLSFFGEDPALGIGGGDVHSRYGGQAVLERQPRFHVRGATKVYSRRCWEAIGGLLRAPGWHTLDEVTANMLGFKTRSFAQLKVVQQRATGAVNGTWHNFVKNGRANYLSGYHPLFVAAKCTRRLFAPPYVIGALGIFAGYTRGYIARERRVVDARVVRYLRRQQMNRLLLRPTIWK